MKINLASFWNRLHSGYWFIPTVMSSAAVALSFAVIGVDKYFHDQVSGVLGRFYSGGAGSARVILETIAGSVTTIAVMVFSITIVVLQLASSQFGPRLLRNFMRDTGNQIVLGTFVSIFVYCLLVLRIVYDSATSNFVPHIAVTIGVLMGVVGLGVLIYFIQHVAQSVKVNNITAQIGAELQRSVERTFPHTPNADCPWDDWGEANDSRSSEDRCPDAAPRTETNKQPDVIGAVGTGYVQAINLRVLVGLATDCDIVFWLACGPGDFVLAEQEIARAYPTGRMSREKHMQARRSIALANDPTEANDAVKVAVYQLVEVAIRALSPSLNDPYTALSCIDWLSAGLCAIAQRAPVSPCHRDSEGRVRVVARPMTFADIAETVFGTIYHYGRSSAEVTLRLLNVIRTVATQTHRDTDREVLRRLADFIEQGSRTVEFVDSQRAVIRECYQAAIGALVLSPEADRQR